ncbi:MAG: IclR family transcriptional regulator [Trueperaceae bacterium]|nr:IclR family transcriptional regulator [Trueperaceae bacterium]MBX3142127.1 IclR family transcriptional regulator [Trueperaceae bacterium]MCC6309972.1 IclR family transcriptional regulator [Trueperaceae bacterium]MCO5173556.1 IclR family transcriptional regulator [Trueperaceae bacterium]MCW5818544.1 IclR family transcriptional regulator [Trueperaceae bacterium]
MSTTLEKALQLVELVSDGDLSLQQLCQASGFSRSTTHRLAASLVKHRYLENKAQRYSLGYRFLELGEKKKSSLQFTKAAKPIAQNYCERTGETVHIAVLDGIYSMVVDRIIGSRQLQVNAYVGQRTLAYRTGAGKAMIASQPEREWLFFLNGIGRKERTRQLVEFAEIKERGYALDLEESASGVACVATAIYGPSGQVVAGVSFNGAITDLTRERLVELAPTIRACAKEIEKAMAASVA